MSSTELNPVFGRVSTVNASIRILNYPPKDRTGPSVSYGLRKEKKCDCGAPVFEIAGCGECGTPWLKASRIFKDPHEYLQQSQRTNDADEYVLEVEPDDTGEQTTSTASEEVWIGSSDRGLVLQLDSSEVLPSAVNGKKCVTIRLVESASDRNCCDQSRYSNMIPQRFGAPFLMGNAMPALLQFLPVPQ